MSRTERLALVVLLFIAIGLWIVVGWPYFQKGWQMPLGPALALPSQTPAPGAVFLTFEPAAPPTTAPIETMMAPTPTVAGISGAGLCGGPNSLTVLAIGSDSRASGYLYGLGDVIRYVRIDFITPRVSILEFPRDLWVQIPELDPKHGIDHGKLNQAYLYGNKGMGYYTGPGEGPGLLARTLDLNFGARPDHYIAANMQTFARLVNVIGGVDVYLPSAVDARKPDQANRKDLYFEAGSHHLNGEQALMLARIRQYSTFSRADNQNLILCAVRDALLNPYNLPKLPEIITTFNGVIQTDLSPQQLGQLACLLPQLEPQNITFYSFPLTALKLTRTYDKGVDKNVSILAADFDTLRLYVSAFNKGRWPVEILPAGVTVTPGAPKESGFICP